MSAIQALAQTREGMSVSHAPECCGNQHRKRPGGYWLELLANGLVFDLYGIAPGQPAPVPNGQYQFDLQEFAGLLEQDLEAITMVPGPHLRGGEAMLPVVRTICGLAAELSDLPGLEVIAWHGADSWMSPAYSKSSTTHWLEGGPFPALGLTALKPTPDGGLQTVGLEFFTGQELRIEPELAGEKTQAARLAVRLINHLVEEGTLRKATHIELPNGDRLLLESSSNGFFVRARAA